MLCRSNCKDQFNKNKNFDLAFVGDSFLPEGIGVNFENSFAGIVSSDLKKLRIANLAASSYSSINLLFKNKLFIE